MLNNAKLNSMLKLSSKITVYIPSTTDINKAIDNTKYINAAATLLSSLKGGATYCQVLDY